MELIDKVELINSLKLLAKFEGEIRTSVILGMINTAKKQKTVNAVPVEEYLNVCKERDAAVSNLKQSFSDTYTPCHWCKNNIDGQTCLKGKDFCFSMNCWEWGGVQGD